MYSVGPKHYHKLCLSTCVCLYGYVKHGSYEDQLQDQIDEVLHGLKSNALITRVHVINNLVNGKRNHGQEHTLENVHCMLL